MPPELLSPKRNKRVVGMIFRRVGNHSSGEDNYYVNSETDEEWSVRSGEAKVVNQQPIITASMATNAFVQLPPSLELVTSMSSEASVSTVTAEDFDSFAASDGENSIRISPDQRGKGGVAAALSLLKGSLLGEEEVDDPEEAVNNFTPKGSKGGVGRTIARGSSAAVVTSKTLGIGSMMSEKLFPNNSDDTEQPSSDYGDLEAASSHRDLSYRESKGAKAILTAPIIDPAMTNFCKQPGGKQGWLSKGPRDPCSRCKQAPRSIKIIGVFSVLLAIVSIITVVSLTANNKNTTIQPMPAPQSPSAIKPAVPVVFWDGPSKATDTCRDRVDVTFRVNGRKRDCAWLADTVAYQIFLCWDGREQYDLCPQTCGNCPT